MAVAGTVELNVDGGVVRGDLTVPEGSASLVVFAHGSGSSRHSPRNRRVAERLRQAGFASLLLDLLTETEERVAERTGRLRFGIDLLAGRLESAVNRLDAAGGLGHLDVGCFGASTGAAAALLAAARQVWRISAVMSRGGRPELAGDALGDVVAPTLLIVGGRDKVVIGLNRRALGRLRADHRLEIIPGATHLFEEPGALEQVAGLAADWFTAHLAGAAARTAS